MRKNDTIHILLVALLALASCKNGGKTVRKVRIHQYVGTNSATPDANDLLYWYVISGSNGSNYYYSSPVPVTNFSSITFQRSTSVPTKIVGDAKEEEEIEAEDVLEAEGANAAEAVEEESAPAESEPSTQSEPESESGSDNSASDGGDGGSSGGE